MSTSSFEIKHRKRPKRGDGWVFLLLLLLSAVFWLLSKLNNEGYEKDFSVTISVVNFEQNKFLSGPSKYKVHLKGKGNGYELLRSAFVARKPLEIDASRYTAASGEIRIPLNTVFSDYFPRMELGEIKPQELNIAIETRLTKKVPVRAIYEIELASGFDFVKRPAIYPDSVEVYGPKNILSQINEISTAPFTQKNAANSILEQLPLINPFRDTVVLQQNKVDFRADISRFTEKRFIVPISTEGLYQLGNGRIVPNEVEVICKVSIADFPLLKMEHFKIIPIVPENNQIPDFLQLKIVEQSPYAKSIFIKPEQVDYILLQ